MLVLRRNTLSRDVMGSQIAIFRQRTLARVPPFVPNLNHAQSFLLPTDRSEWWVANPTSPLLLNSRPVRNPHLWALHN